MNNKTPLIAITMGDPSGVGPEVIVGSWTDISDSECRRFVVGRVDLMKRACKLLQKDLRVIAVDSVAELAFEPEVIPVLQIGDEKLDEIEPCKVSAAGGEVAYQAVVTAAKLAISGEIDAMVTAPLNKAALSAAGYSVPGHTELLGELCEVNNFAMMLYLPPSEIVKGEIGLGVVHTTLHTALRNVFKELSHQAIVDKCQLAHGFGQALLAAHGIERSTQVGVAALNPHAGEGGLFGDEEITMIEPAVKEACELGISATGPLPCDTLMHRAAAGRI